MNTYSSYIPGIKYLQVSTNHQQIIIIIIIIIIILYDDGTVLW